MPFLMVNLDDMGDCRRALRHLHGLVDGPFRKGPGCGEGGPRRGPGRHQEGHAEGPGKGPGWRGVEQGKGLRKRAIPEDEGLVGEEAKLAKIRALPLPAKLERMKQRGLWKHLVAIAKQGEGARSLAEFDHDLSLPANKMRSLKAIMAKLENRFELHFLNVDLEAGQDAAGNPRYAMPPRVRKQILKLADM